MRHLNKFLLSIISLSLGTFSMAQTTVNFNYTGAVQQFVVPPCVYSIDVDVRGAEGGGAGAGTGGNGAQVTATIAVNPGDVLEIYVGGEGACPAGGWNGGGNGWIATGGATPSCGGGGASDVRVAPYGLADRIVVAAGGGGTGGGDPYNPNGGAGGCANGGNGLGSPFTVTGGNGASQVAGGAGGPPWGGGQWGQNGALGQGGNGGYYSTASGGGGGGGYYGGGGGGSDNCCMWANGGGAAGGGSSLTPPGGNCNMGINAGDGVVSFTFLGVAQPNPTNTGPYCAGDTIFLASDTGATTYSWVGPNGFTSSVQNPVIPNSTTAMSGMYIITFTTPSCVGVDTTIVTVNPLPTPSITPLNPSICRGESVDLTASGATTYNWSPGTDLSGTVGAVVTSTPTSSPITYTVAATDVNGCVSTTSSTVSFHPDPVVNITAVPPSICAGFSTQLTATGAVNYTWSPATGLSNTGISNPVATLNTTQAYTIIGEDANGCFDTTGISITVNPNPVADYSAVDQRGCVPHTVDFINNSSITSGSIVSYFWTFEHNGGSSATDPTVVLNNNGDYDVTLIAVSDMGCTDTLTFTDYISGYSVPTAGFYATPQPTNIEDGLIHFNNTSSTDVVNCFFDFGDGYTAAYCEPEHQYINPGTYTVTLITTTQYGCADTIIADVVIDDIYDMFIPNSFTPNADGINDTWFPVGKNLDSDNITIEVEVFNRWGDSVYKGNSPDKAWTGNVTGTDALCPQGTYVYRVYYKDIYGDERIEMGAVNLIR